MAKASADTREVHEAIACLGRLSEAFRRRRAELAEAVGLTEHQWGVLEEISREHFMPSMFAKTRSSSPAAVSKTLRQLIDKGLVRVALSAADGRQREYLLSPRGKKTLEKVRAARELAIERIWLPLDRAQLRAFVAFGSALTERLLEYASQN